MIPSGSVIVFVFVVTAISGQLVDDAKAVTIKPESSSNFEAAFQGKSFTSFALVAPETEGIEHEKFKKLCAIPLLSSCNVEMSSKNKLFVDFYHFVLTQDVPPSALSIWESI